MEYCYVTVTLYSFFFRQTAPIRYVTKENDIFCFSFGSANRGPLLRYCSANSTAVLRYGAEGFNKLRYSVVKRYVLQQVLIL